MLTPDFNATFNQAIETKDWSLVIMLGEEAVAENAASNAVLYNLGLAYLKQNKPSMATSVFLSVPSDQRDLKTSDALSESLRLSTGSMDDLSLGAHGLKGSLVTAAAAIPANGIQAIFMAGLGFLIVALLTIVFSRATRWRRWLQISLVLGVLLSTFGGAGFALNRWYSGNWGAIISGGMAPLMSSPIESSSVVANLKPGYPVFVLGAKEGPWLRIWDADGHEGWIKSLDVRVIAAQR
jgi:uncharacterized membrane protein YgdD (TMEM256/DUF423 family)